LAAQRPRLDVLLVERGLLDDVRTAQAWIMSRKVRVDGEYVTKPGTRVSESVEVHVLGLDRRYASRGGLKLEAALARFAVDVSGATALDAGASTGGFTDCLLQHGAARVYSVDVGYGQLRGSLRSDPRVVCLERTNIGDLARERFAPPLDLAVVDLSYLSLTRAIPILVPLFERPVHMVCLVKPLFEWVADEDVERLDLLHDVFETLALASRACGTELVDLMVSPIRGSGGTLEFLARIAADGEPRAPLEGLTGQALEEAARLLASPPPQGPSG
jgi:23S rRNA (cytidine1920-2'-O)/16S rRNA (cytidine1409-2'-O)-methyltransferase